MAETPTTPIPYQPPERGVNRSALPELPAVPRSAPPHVLVDAYDAETLPVAVLALYAHLERVTPWRRDAACAEPE